MTDFEKQHLKKLIVATSLYYGHDLADEALALYVEDLEDLPLQDVMTAIRDARRDPKTTRMPLPAVIRDRIQPAETSEADAREAAARIVSAVASCGWNNPERAKEYVGELGWHVVQMAGGWLNVCETLTHDNVGQLQAQWRELALSSIRRANYGTLHIAPKLPNYDREAKNQLAAFNDLLKQIPHENGEEDKP